MNELTDFDKGQIVGAQVAGLSVEKTAELCGVSVRTVLKVMSIYNKDDFAVPETSRLVQKKRKTWRRTRAKGQDASVKPAAEPLGDKQNPDAESKVPDSETNNQE